MILKSLQLPLVWPSGISVSALRHWLRQELAHHGEPLRWAITSVQTLPDGRRQLQLEAVILLEDQEP